MKVFRVSRKKSTWCEDFSMVVIAEDKLHAERKARWSSSDFKEELKSNLKIEEIPLDREYCILIANQGS